jgi:tRNA (guanosine-2'-O-)-methyltransferase
MPTEERIARVTGVLSRRQPDLRIILERITNAHNANAVLRTCDAAGILHIDLIGPEAEPFLINKAITTRADKWLDLHYHASTAACLGALRERGFQVAVTCLAPDAVDYTELDYAKPTAVVFGNESDGVSPEALALSDVRIRIPMLGMAQSLNLSVSAGVILYEALRQRRARGFFDGPRLSPADLEAYAARWLAAPEKDEGK